MNPMLEISDFHVAYGKVEAVRGVSLSLQQGQIITVIGPNGAGKTTLLSAVIGLLPARGRLLFEGEDLFKLDVEGRAERGFCLVPEKRELFGESRATTSPTPMPRPASAPANALIRPIISR